MNTEQYVKWFRSTSPYINANRGKTFVFALRGEILAHENFPVLVEDLLLLQSLGVRLVLCLGAQPQIEQALANSGSRAGSYSGQLIVDEQALPLASATIGELYHSLEAALSRNLDGARLKAGPHGVIRGNFVTAKPLGVLDGLDHQHSGSVRKVDAAGICKQLDLANIVVLPALAASPSGELFALDARELACSAACALQADKLILFSDQPGLMEEGELVRELSLQQAKSRQQQQGNTAWSNLDCAIAACEAGVERSQIVSYTDASALLTELFSRDGSGTLISRDLFETIRAATIDDISSVLELISPLERDGTLVKRSREKLEEEIQYFTVIERDASLVACAALYPFENTRAAELACVVTHADYRNSGRAAKLLEHIVSLARQQNIDSLFVLTTKAAHWFLENGFKEAGKDDLPVERQALYNLQRNSKVLVRSL